MSAMGEAFDLYTADPDDVYDRRDAVVLIGLRVTFTATPRKGGGFVVETPARPGVASMAPDARYVLAFCRAVDIGAFP